MGVSPLSDLVSESLALLPTDELLIVTAKCDEQADKLHESEPGWSTIWRAISLAAEQILLARRTEAAMVRQELELSSV